MAIKLVHLFGRRRNGKKSSKRDSTKRPKRLGSRLTHKDSTTGLYPSSCYSLEEANSRHGICKVIELSNNVSSFQEQFKAIRPSKKDRALVLLNFVETATRHDIYALRDLLGNEKIHWKRVQLVDNAPSAGHPRWRYKKDNVCHHIKNLCEAREIDLTFEASIDLVVEELPSFEKLIDVIDQVEKDYEITQLTLRGSLDARQTEIVFQKMTSLVSNEHRRWDRVRLDLSWQGRDPREYVQWRKTMGDYGFLYATMKTHYGIPIEMEYLYHHQ